MLAQLSSAMSSTGDAHGGIGVIGVLAIVLGVILVLLSGALWLRRRPHRSHQVDPTQEGPESAAPARLDELHPPDPGARPASEDRCG